MSEVVVANNKVVSLAYTLRDEQGEVFEHTDIPISYLHGSDNGLLDKIENTLAGHKVGDKLSVTLPPADGFGEYDPELTFTDDIDNVPEDMRQVGMQFEAHDASGETMVFRVTDVNGSKLTADANHPLVGQTVQFEIEIKEIRDASAEELENGVSGTANGDAGILQ